MKDRIYKFLEFFFFSPMLEMFMSMMGMGTSRPGQLSRQRRDSGDACETEVKKNGYSHRELYLAHKWVSISSVQCKNPGQSCSTNSCPTFGHECRSG